MMIAVLTVRLPQIMVIVVRGCQSRCWRWPGGGLRHHGTVREACNVTFFAADVTIGPGEQGPQVDGLDIELIPSRGEGCHAQTSHNLL